MPLRTFLALDVDEAIRDRILAARRSIDVGGAKVNWVEPLNLHVTLHFLGDVDDALLPEVLLGVEAAAGEVEPFDFDLRGVQAVPPAGRVRMFWVGVTDPTGRMARLYDTIRAALDDLPIRQERRQFKPHVTLGRVKYAPHEGPLRRAAAALAGEDFGVQYAEHVTAYTSQLTSSGPIYRAVAKARLGG